MFHVHARLRGWGLLFHIVNYFVILYWYIVLFNFSYVIIDDSYINITQFIFLQSLIIDISCFYYIDILWPTLLYLYCTLILFCFFFSMVLCDNSIPSLLWSYTFTLFICLFFFFSGLSSFILTFFLSLSLLSHYSIYYNYIYYIFWIWLSTKYRNFLLYSSKNLAL